MKKLALSVVTVALSAMPAFAADMPVKAKVAPVVVVSPWDVAFGGALMTDYIFRGVTQSNHKPSVAAYIEPRFNINPNLQLYAGISGESISFPNRAASEIDFYAGIRPTFGQLALDFGAWYYYYPGGQCFNVAAFCGSDTAQGFLPNFSVAKAKASFWEIYFKPTWNVNDAFALGGNLFYTPSFANTGAKGTYASATAKYTFPGTVLPNGIGAYVSGEFGRQWLGTSDSFYGILPAFPAGIKYADYNTWNVGIGFTYKVFTLDLRYSDTNLSKGNCNAFTSDFTAPAAGTNITPINPGGGGSNWCGSAFVAKLSFDLTNANLK
jgi:uncharacterized protein (TIGR02001 family)